jgi:hypothetical protein
MVALAAAHSIDLAQAGPASIAWNDSVPALISVNARDITIREDNLRQYRHEP